MGIPQPERLRRHRVQHYGGFWIGLALWVIFVAEKAPAGSPAVGKDIAWILLAFAIFNTYMLIWSAALNMAVFMVFLTLELTEIVLFIGGFAASTSIIKVGGYLGIITALVAWYTSVAGVISGMSGRPVLPVGRALFDVSRSPQSGSACDPGRLPQSPKHGRPATGA